MKLKRLCPLCGEELLPDMYGLDTWPEGGVFHCKGCECLFRVEAGEIVLILHRRAGWVTPPKKKG